MRLKILTSSIKHLNGALKKWMAIKLLTLILILGVEFDGTFGGLIKLAPVAIFTTFFRPFIWESHKISQLLASLESLVLLFFTIYVFSKVEYFFLKLILTDPLIMYCFLFSLVFAIFVGCKYFKFWNIWSDIKFRVFLFIPLHYF